MIILERLQHDNTVSSDVVLLSRAKFLYNMFFGSNLPSAFKLVRGYTPALLRSRSSLVSPELLQAYKDQKYIRVLHRNL